MYFVWDHDKERKNISKHCIDFDTAVSVFNDNNRIEMYDEEHSADEDRFITIGMVGSLTIVVTVVYTYRDPAIRIISARTATKAESEVYYGDRGKRY
ncbi:MAG: BrnT family toxin [Clostridiales bacterium]|nr:BrnT family toxin [Clostridiales bacterium]